MDLAGLSAGSCLHLSVKSPSVRHLRVPQGVPANGVEPIRDRVPPRAVHTNKDAAGSQATRSHQVGSGFASRSVQATGSSSGENSVPRLSRASLECATKCKESGLGNFLGEPIEDPVALRVTRSLARHCAVSSCLFASQPSECRSPRPPNANCIPTVRCINA